MQLRHVVAGAIVIGGIVSFVLLGTSRASDPDAGDWAVATAAPTPAFSGLSVHDARARARDQHKLLLIDSTASWCPPCRAMEASTWREPRVVDWISRNAVAVQVDVDHLQAVAGWLQIRAMPTMVLIRDGQELDRETGFLSADQLLAWLDWRLAHEHDDAALVLPSENARIPYEGIPDDGDGNVLARAMATNKALSEGRYAEALAGIEWLWVHGEDHGKAYWMMRGELLVPTITSLTQASPPARTALQGLLDCAQRTVDAERLGTNVWYDWIYLCKALGEESRFDDWLRRNHDRDGSIDSGRFCRCGWIADSLYEAYLEQHRYADAVALFRHPAEKATTYIAFHKLVSGEAAQGSAATVVSSALILTGAASKSQQLLRDQVAKLSAALVAAGRDEEALDAAHRLLQELDDGASRKTLVTWALDWAHPLPDHERWYAEALELGTDMGDLGDRLQAAISR